MPVTWHRRGQLRTAHPKQRNEHSRGTSIWPLARPNQRNKGHSGYEADGTQIKDGEKSALIISNFSATLNLFLRVAPASKLVFHFWVGGH
jgi:hypothetical protein